MKRSSRFLFSLPVAAAGVLFLAGCKDQGDSGGGTPGDYPLTTCVVSGKDLNSMGGPHVIDYKGTTVKFCCESCVDDFNADPEKYLAKLR